MGMAFMALLEPTTVLLMATIRTGRIIAMTKIQIHMGLGMETVLRNFDIGICQVFHNMRVSALRQNWFAAKLTA
jgi:hypothetical protein